MIMKRIMLAALALALALSLPAFPVKAKALCVSRHAAKPAALAASLLPVFERLYEGIPSLSPKEAQWLKEELVAPGKRSDRAFSSREYALLRAKTNSGSLLGGIRFLTGAVKVKPPRSPTDDWLHLVYNLIEDDVDMYLARLVTEGVIQRELMPFYWIFIASTNYGELRLGIRSGRARLARHILVCTLPKVTGIAQ